MFRDPIGIFVQNCVSKWLRNSNGMANGDIQFRVTVRDRPRANGIEPKDTCVPEMSEGPLAEG